MAMSSATERYAGAHCEAEMDSQQHQEEMQQPLDVDKRLSKRKLQNRVAQRAYRQRMKVRVQELESTIATLITTSQQQTQQPPSECEPHSTSVSPHVAKSLLDPLQGSLLDTGQELTLLESYDEVTGGQAPVAQMVPPQSSEISSTAESMLSGLDHRFSPERSVRTAAARSPAITMGDPTDISATSTYPHSHSEGLDYFDDAFWADGANYWDEEVFPGPDSDNSAMTDVSVPNPTDDGSTEPISSTFSAELTRLGPRCDMVEDTGSVLPDKAATRTACSRTSNTSADQNTWPQSERTASSEERLRSLAEQAKLIGFPDLDALVMAYYDVPMRDRSRLSRDTEGGLPRRVPMLVATLRYVMREWQDWAQKGFPLD